jgi:hypothetical protein
VDVAVGVDEAGGVSGDTGRAVPALSRTAVDAAAYEGEGKGEGEGEGEEGDNAGTVDHLEGVAGAAGEAGRRRESGLTPSLRVPLRFHCWR